MEGRTVVLIAHQDDHYALSRILLARNPPEPVRPNTWRYTLQPGSRHLYVIESRCVFGGLPAQFPLHTPIGLIYTATHNNLPEERLYPGATVINNAGILARMCCGWFKDEQLERLQRTLWPLPDVLQPERFLAQAWRQFETAVLQAERQPRPVPQRWQAEMRRAPPPTPPSTPTSNVATLCLACEEQAPDVVLMPCKHQCMCGACTERWMENTPTCPKCRTPVADVIKVFL